MKGVGFLSRRDLREVLATRIAIQQLECPICGNRSSKVQQTNAAELAGVECVKRNRECRNGHRYWTVEMTIPQVNQLPYPDAQAKQTMVEKLRIISNIVNHPEGQS